MSKKFTNNDPYDASVDQMWAMLSDQAYWKAKYESLGADNVTFTAFEASDTQIRLTNERDVPADLPSFAKKIVGDTNHTTHTETYSRAGDDISGTADIRIKNVPGGMVGTYKISATASGSTWAADYDIKVSIPMVGGKLEGVMRDETASNFKQEKVFNDQWLANNG